MLSKREASLEASLEALTSCRATSCLSARPRRQVLRRPQLTGNRDLRDDRCRYKGCHCERGRSPGSLALDGDQPNATDQSRPVRRWHTGSPLGRSGLIYFSCQTSAHTSAYNKIAASYTNETKAHALALKLVKAVGAVAKLPIVLSVIGDLPDEANRAAVVQQSAAAVGLNVKLKVVTGAQYGALFSSPASRKGIDLVQTLNYDQHPDPLALNNDIALPNAISNFGSYIDPAIVKLLTQANGEMNLDKRRAGRPGADAHHQVHAVDPTCLQPRHGGRRQGRVRGDPRPQSDDGPMGRVSRWLLVVTE